MTLQAYYPKLLKSIGLELMFCNTYHLMLQPGVDVIKKAGGIHKFIGRNMPIITDSGGFQVFSLAFGSVADEIKSKGQKKTDGSVLKINEEGVVFRSYRDGEKLCLTPEKSVQAQKDIGADIIIPFDELPPYHLNLENLTRSLERTHRWEKRSLEYHLKDKSDQSMYGVIHGGISEELRKKSCSYLTKLDFDGFAIGGSIGKNKEEVFKIVDFTTKHLPLEKPIHLLGIGDIESLNKGVLFGIDTFDSSYPTKAARHGLALGEKSIKITRRENKHLFEPLDKNCNCYTCMHYDRAYLHHLFKAKEITALSLTTIHNLHFMVNHMKNLREMILNDAI